MSTNLDPLPIVRTTRLILDSFLVTDADRVAQLAGSREIADSTMNIPHPYQIEDARRWIAGHAEMHGRGLAVHFAIRSEPHQLLGCVSLGISPRDRRAELGYWIGRPFWGRGYATEAADACVKLAFDRLGLIRITSRHFLANPASGRVLEKIGMTREGLLPCHLFKAGVWHDIAEYGLLRAQLDVPRMPQPIAST